MPNTLAHLGLQVPLSRMAVPYADLKWIALGCVIPDVPWIVQRGVLLLFPSVDPYGLRLYAMVQASLLFSLLLAAAASLCTRRWPPVLALLGANATLHLLIDACQTKWANGVHFLAPFSWHLTSWDFFWPDSLPAWLLSAAGLMVVAAGWRQAVNRPAGLLRPRGRKAAAVAVLIGVYFGLPPWLTGGPLVADCHSVATILAGEQRTGRLVEFDRADFVPTAAGARLITWGGERLEVIGRRPDQPGKISARAEFVAPSSIRLRAYHLHDGPSRDWASAVGITLTIALWMVSLRARRRSG